MTDTNLDLKKKLLAECFKMQRNIVNNARNAMLEAQESANEQDDNTEEKLFDSYREEMQNKRDMFAKQYEKVLEEMALLNKVDPEKAYDTASFGTVIITEAQSLFVAISLGQITIDGKAYFAVSPSAPLFKAISGKKKGETFMFRDKPVKVLEVF
jgi:hypothetical protein